MKKIKVYLNVVDELDVIKGIFKLLSYIPPSDQPVVVRFPVEQMEYEDEEHKMIYADDMILKIFEALGFSQCKSNPDIYQKGNVFLTYYRKFFDDFDNTKRQYIVIERLFSNDFHLLEEVQEI